MARAFWKGSISFGMVVIPVRMYTATTTRTPALHYLHKKCLTPPKQVLYCQQDNEQFSIKETVRGYEYATGQYVVLEEADFKKVPLKTAHTIDIQAFVNAEAIDHTYYFGVHYIEPEDIGAKPFSLLRDVLTRTKRVGVAKVAFQRREHLCALRPLDDILVLHTMRFQDEILPHDGLSAKKYKASPQEMEMASTLVNAMAGDFKPEQYRNEYGEALQKVIEAKLSGQKLKTPKAPTSKAGTVDLMAALRSSVEQVLKESEDKEPARTGKK